MIKTNKKKKKTASTSQVWQIIWIINIYSYNQHFSAYQKTKKLHKTDYRVVQRQSVKRSNRKNQSGYNQSIVDFVSLNLGLFSTAATPTLPETNPCYATADERDSSEEGNDVEKIILKPVELQGSFGREMMRPVVTHRVRHGALQPLRRCLGLISEDRLRGQRSFSIFWIVQ